MYDEKLKKKFRQLFIYDIKSIDAVVLYIRFIFYFLVSYEIRHFFLVDKSFIQKGVVITTK